MRYYNMTKAVEGKDTDFFNKYFIRKISIPLTEIVAKHTSITPDSLSYLGILVAAISLYFFINGMFKLGALCLFVVCVLDSVDGKLARVLNTKSQYGAWLDGMIDIIFLPTLMLAVALGTGYHVIGLFAVLAFGLEFMIAYKWKAEFASKLPKKSQHMGVKKESPLRFIYGGHLAFHLMYPAALFGLMYWYLLFFAVIGNLFNLAMLFMQWRQLR